MFHEINLAPFLEFYDCIQVLEIKVLDSKLKQFYIEKANEYNQIVFSDPSTAGKDSYENKFFFYLTKEALMSNKKKYAPYQLNIQLKVYYLKKDKAFASEFVFFDCVPNGSNYLHYLDERKTNISGVFQWIRYDDDKERDEIRLPKGHASFYYQQILNNEPMYVKIVDDFTFDKPSYIKTSGYHRGSFHDGYNPDADV